MLLAFCHASFSGSEAVQSFGLSGIATVLALSQESPLSPVDSELQLGDSKRLCSAKC